MASETKKFTLTMKRRPNDKLMDVSKELAKLLNESHYGLSLFYGGQSMKLSDRLGDNQIGMIPLKQPPSKSEK